jgi:hypothetical protein
MKIVEHGLDHLDEETEAVKDFKRLVDLHESQQQQKNVHIFPLILKTGTPIHVIQWKVGKEIENNDEKICPVPYAC